MTIIFYKTLSKPNEINKVLQNIFTITGNFKTDTDIIKPIINSYTKDSSKLCG